MTAQHPAVLHCPQCGREQTGGGRFCIFCGAVLPIIAAAARAEAEPAAPPQPSAAPASGAAATPPVERATTARPSPAARKQARFSLGDTAEDLAHGQVVIVTARWILVLSGLILALWNPAPIGELRVQIGALLVLAVANFYLHAQILQRRQTLESVVYGSSLADLAVITGILLAGGGFNSNIYIFYFPAILAFSVAFPTAITFMYTGATMLVYTLLSLNSLAGAANATDLQVLVTRLIMLAGVAVCGNLYQRIEGDRRKAAVEAQQALLAEIRQRDGAAASPL